MKVFLFILIFSFYNLLFCQKNPFIKINDQYEFQEHEVTFSEYRECINNKQCKIPKNLRKRGSITEYLIKGIKYKGELFQNIEDMPIFEVSLKEAMEYCHFLNSDLPTENEFVEICTNGGKTIYPWGNEYNDKLIYTKLPIDSKKRVNNAKDERFRQNMEGLIGLIGNLFEMTQSCYDKDGNYYERYEDNCEVIVAKGGCFLNTKINLNCKSKNKFSKDGDFLLGFRCIKRKK